MTEKEKMDAELYLKGMDMWRKFANKFQKSYTYLPDGLYIKHRDYENGCSDFVSGTQGLVGARKEFCDIDYDTVVAYDHHKDFRLYCGKFEELLMKKSMFEKFQKLMKGNNKLSVEIRFVRGYNKKLGKSEKYIKYVLQKKKMIPIFTNKIEYKLDVVDDYSSYIK